MKNLYIIVIALFIFGCTTNTIVEADLQNLNGYWEIEKVIFSDGATKEYKANSTIDFFKIDGLRGIRKKVQPKIGGTYVANNDVDSLKIIEKDGIFNLFSKNRKSEREEKITSLSENEFSVKDNQNTTYLYKRYIPIVIE